MKQISGSFFSYPFILFFIFYSTLNSTLPAIEGRGVKGLSQAQVHPSAPTKSNDIKPLSKEAEEEHLKALSARLQIRRQEAISQVDQSWQTPPPPQTLLLQTNHPNGKSAAMEILRKLDTICIEELDFWEVDITEVVRYLAEQSKLLDPEKKGINFVLKLSEEEPLENRDSKIENQPLLQNTLPLKTAPQASPIKHRVSFSLRRVSLRQTLDTISRLTGLKIKIEEFAVFIFSPQEMYNALSVETFTVDSNFFNSELNPSSSAGAANVKQALVNRGVIFAPGATAHYFEQTSKLVIRGTPDMIELIRNLLAREYHDLPQVEIETKFIEFTEDQIRAMRARWQLSGNEIIPGLGSLPLGGYGTAAAQTGGLRGVGADGLTLNSGLSQQTLDAQLGRASRQPTTISLAGLVEGHTLRLLIDLMQSVCGSDLMSAPKITVQKGSRGTVRVVKEFIYPRTYTAPALPGNGAGLGGASIIPSNPQDFNFDDPKDVGVLMDVEVVDVQPSSRLIDLNLLNIQMLEFDGFINYGDPITTLDINDQPTTLVEGVALQPLFSARRAQTSIQLRDGQTLVMGGFIRDDVQKVNDKVPILGDIPLIGLLFRSKINQSIKRNLVILTTARLVNMDGRPTYVDPWNDLAPLSSSKD